MEKETVEIVRSVIGPEPADLHKPYLPPKTGQYLQECIDSGNLSAGKFTRRFEEMLCEETGAKYAVAMCNATCALQVTLECLGLKGTIKIPALTFVATANAVTHAGLTPHFTEPLDAELPVDILGHQAPIDGVLRDSAAAFGTDGITGTRIYSFNQNKIITCSLGGALVTDDEALAREVFHLVTTARIPHPWLVEHDRIAYNYRISDINAVIGIAQLEEFGFIMAAKEALAKQYEMAFAGTGVKVITGGNNWLTMIAVEPEKRDAILQSLNDAGYKARCLPTPLHMLKPYENHARDDLTQTENWWRKVICLPSGPQLGMKYL